MLDFTLETIISLLRSEDTRWDAIMQLRSLDQAEVGSLLIPYLSDPEWVIRWIVAEKLGDLGEVEATLPLIKLLRDEDSHVRKNAFKSLIKLGYRSVPEIVTFLAHPAPDFRRQLLEILLEMGDKILPELGQAMGNDNWVIANKVVEIIWRIGGPDAEDLLIEGLDKPLIRKNAIVLLGLMKNKRALAPLLKQFDEPSIRKIILSAFKNIGKEASFIFLIDSLAWKNRGLQHQSEEAILRIGKPILKHLIRGLVKHRAGDRTKILQLIEKIDPEEAMSDIGKLVKKDPALDDFTKAFRIRYRSPGVMSQFLKLLGS